MPEITPEQFWKLYEQLPPDLKEAIFSAETAEHIADACERNGVPPEKNPQVAKYTGRVLLGMLLPEDFQAALEKDVKIKKDVAQQIAREINRFVFFPVKGSLAQLHTITAASSQTPTQRTQRAAAQTAPEAQAAAPDSQRPEPRGSDSYRESVE